MKRVLALNIFLLLTALAASAFDTPVFHHLSSEDGLLNNQVASFLKDSEGYLWIGTYSGICRFDGCRVKTYDLSEEVLEYPDGAIIFLREDAAGNIWIGDYARYVVFSKEYGEFMEPEKVLGDLGLEVPGKVFVSNPGDLWLASPGRLLRYCWKTDSTTSYDLGVLSNIIGLQDNGGPEIYVLCEDQRLFSLDVRGGKVSSIPIPEETFSPNNIFCDQSNTIWLWSNSEDYVYHSTPDGWVGIPLASKLDEDFDSNFVSNVTEGRTKGEIWISTDHKGLFIHSLDDGTTENIICDENSPNSLIENNINTMYRDGDGTVWLGYFNSGLSYHHPSFDCFRNYSDKSFRNANSILVDSKGILWMGTDGYGVICKDPSTGGTVRRLSVPGNIIVSLFEDRHDRIWIGTYLHGLYCVDGDRMTEWSRQNGKIGLDTIWSITEDSQGRIWFSDLHGSTQYIDTTDGTVSGIIQGGDKLFYTGNDRILASTYYGLCEIDTRTAETSIRFGTDDGSVEFFQKRVENVFCDSRGLVWLAHNGGISIWDRQSDRVWTLSDKEGLKAKKIRCFAEDSRGQIWVGSNNGCAIVRTSSTGSDRSFNIRNFTQKEGLADNDIGQQGVCPLGSEKMVLSGISGYSIVDINRLDKKLADQRHKTRITGIIVNGKEIRNNGRPLKLKYSDTNIEISFSSMDLSSASLENYTYRLDGLDRNWRQAPGGKVVFNSLIPGNYNLLLGESDNEEYPSDYISLPIRIKPAAYASWYAICLYIGLLLGFIMMLNKRQKNKMEVERLKMEYQHKNEVSEIKMRFFTNISHDLRTPLTLIISPLRKLLDDTDDAVLKKKLASIYNNAGNLMNLVTQLLDFKMMDSGEEQIFKTRTDFTECIRSAAEEFREYSETRGVNYTIRPSLEPIVSSFDTDKIRKVTMNLLSNAFKYTPTGGSIDIETYSEDGNACFKVSDTGPGIPDKDKNHIFERFYQAEQGSEFTGSGIGLHIVSEYVRLHEGKVSIQDNSPSGSIFTVSIPVCVEEASAQVPVNEPNAVGSGETILFVDDNVEFLEFLTESFSVKYRTLTAHNGVDALEIIDNERVDMVVSDVMMPEMDGLTLCGRIKSDLNYCHISVILLTARTTDNNQMEGFKNGADDYITKPFNIKLLEFRIARILEWHRNARNTILKNVSVPPEEVTINELDKQFLTKAHSLVEKYMDDPEFSVETFSGELAMSRSNLYKKITALTGLGPAEFIRKIRLERSREMLKESGMNISEIAYSVGFSSPKIFSRNFKNEFGVLPSDYLKKNN